MKKKMHVPYALSFKFYPPSPVAPSSPLEDKKREKCEEAQLSGGEEAEKYAGMYIEFLRAS